MDFEIRPIRPSDDPTVGDIIREVMTEFGAVGEGYSITDPEVDHMSQAYEAEGHGFWVVQVDEVVLGCGGIAPLAGAAPDVCELRKMYFRPALRGSGAAQALIDECLAAAREMGYEACYLETLQSMSRARAFYRRNGFADLEAPMGRTGHTGCNSWMLRKL